MNREIWGRFSKVTTIAGNGKSGFKDGNALEATLSKPWTICLSTDGRLCINDVNNNSRVLNNRMIYNNQITTIAGNGQRGFKDGNALEDGNQPLNNT